MAEARKKRLSAAARRDVILSAALDEFARAGYEVASMDRIAAASGVSKPVLYDHFPSKLALYEAALERVREQLLALGSQTAQEVPAGIERVRASARSFFGFVRDNPTAARVLLQRTTASEEAVGAYDRVQEVATDGIALLLAGAVKMKPGQRKLVAEYHKSGLHSLARLMLEVPRLEAESLAELATTLIWSGLGQSG